MSIQVINDNTKISNNNTKRSNVKEEKQKRASAVSTGKTIGALACGGYSAVKSTRKLFTFSNVDKYRKKCLKGKSYFDKPKCAELGDDALKNLMHFRKKMTVVWLPVSLILWTTVGSKVGKLLGHTYNLFKLEKLQTKNMQVESPNSSQQPQNLQKSQKPAADKKKQAIEAVEDSVVKGEQCKDNVLQKVSDFDKQISETQDMLDKQQTPKPNSVAAPIDYKKQEQQQV